MEEEGGTTAPATPPPWLRLCGAAPSLGGFGRGSRSSDLATPATVSSLQKNMVKNLKT